MSRRGGITPVFKYCQKPGCEKNNLPLKKYCSREHAPFGDFLDELCESRTGYTGSNDEGDWDDDDERIETDYEYLVRIKSAKSKGRRLAERVKTEILDHFRDLTIDDVTVTSSSASGKDLTLSAAALVRFPFVIECKNQERLNVWESLKQAMGHLKPGHLESGRYPLLVFARNHTEPYACVRLVDLMQIMKVRK